MLIRMDYLKLKDRYAEACGSMKVETVLVQFRLLDERFVNLTELLFKVKPDWLNLFVYSGQQDQIPTRNVNSNSENGKNVHQHP